MISSLPYTSIYTSKSKFIGNNSLQHSQAFFPSYLISFFSSLLKHTSIEKQPWLFACLVSLVLRKFPRATLQFMLEKTRRGS
ncbi:hypothetical protein Godav_014574 [Gossypium davidsonii]|uniref:Uncharacterized protein n=2 Tax=Gossypium TaxID=3633 RepID=A0A7J8RKK4_GOSDV|nr:hypothetical protein [Gossypium davidsonii]MBA0649473.1 hypothetical protein [Gossypium klotzschianum]